MATPRKKLSNKSGKDVLYKQSSGMVYYKRLAEDAKVNPFFGTLYSNAVSSLSNAQSFATSNLPHIASSLKVQAQNELSKELQALQEAWGVTFTSEELQSSTFYKDLIEAMNAVMQTKEVYERNMARIKYEGQTEDSSLAKIDISQMFGSYFASYWKDGGQATMTQAIRKELQAWRDLDAYSVAKAIDSELPELINKTLIRMLESKPFDARWSAQEAKDANADWQSSIDAGTNPYIKLADELRQAGGNLNNNPLLKKVWQEMGFDKMKEDMLKEINKLDRPGKVKKNAEKILTKGIGKITGSASVMGNLAEVILTAIASIANANTNVSVIHGGSINKQKPDLVFFYRADPTKYLNYQQALLADEDLREKAKNSIRMQNVMASTALGEWMSNDNPITQQGFNFIAYVNAKTYSLGKKFNGFKGETNLSMDTLSNILTRDTNLSVRGANALISQLVQFTKGAVGDGKDPGSILNSFAEVIANFLFDDYATLCSSLIPDGHNALHFFALEGIYVPLSFFLNKVSEAIEMCSNEVDSFFKFSLLTGTIKYGSLPLEDFEPGMWAEQREEAMAQTRISLVFLRNFQELMRAL